VRKLRAIPVVRISDVLEKKEKRKIKKRIHTALIASILYGGRCGIVSGI
jgi:hypothetical protein